MQQKASENLAERGYSPETVKLAHRFFNGQIEPNEMVVAMRKFGGAYYYHLRPLLLMRELVLGLRMKRRLEALIFGFGELLKGWTVMDRLNEIRVSTLVVAGQDDFQFPPDHQAELAAGITGAHLEIIEHAGHNVQSEQPLKVIRAVKNFIETETPFSRLIASCFHIHPQHTI